MRKRFVGSIIAAVIAALTAVVWLKNSNFNTPTLASIDSSSTSSRRSAELAENPPITALWPPSLESVMNTDPNLVSDYRTSVMYIPGKPVVLLLQDLGDDLSRGDLSALRLAHAALRYCARGALLYNDKDASASMFQSYKDLCAGLNIDAIQSRREFAWRAAKAGDVLSSLNYYDDGPIDGVDLSKANPQEVNQWRHDAKTFLEAAALKGSTEALHSLAFGLGATPLSGVGDPVLGADRELALTYMTAYVQTAAEAGTKPETIERLIAPFRQNLSEQSIAVAQANGLRLFQKCCSNRR